MALDTRQRAKDVGLVLPKCVYKRPPNHSKFCAICGWGAHTADACLIAKRADELYKAQDEKKEAERKASEKAKLARQERVRSYRNIAMPFYLVGHNVVQSTL